MICTERELKQRLSLYVFGSNKEANSIFKLTFREGIVAPAYVMLPRHVRRGFSTVHAHEQQLAYIEPRVHGTDFDSSMIGRTFPVTGALHNRAA